MDDLAKLDLELLIRKLANTEEPLSEALRQQYMVNIKLLLREFPKDTETKLIEKMATPDGLQDADLFSWHVTRHKGLLEALKLEYFKTTLEKKVWKGTRREGKEKGRRMKLYERYKSKKLQKN